MPSRLLATSLRVRLILAFSAVVSLLLAVGLGSWAINHRIQGDVARLRASVGVDLTQVDLSNLGLEIEGRWDPAGYFVARDVELLPGLRRPKLRGAIADIDPGQGTLRMYGRTMAVPASTEFLPPDGPAGSLADLHVGQRVEVTCEVRDGRWFADKLRSGAIKSSDKLKGTPTEVDLEREGQQIISIHGLEVVLTPVLQRGQQSATTHIHTATQLTMALYECRAMARELVGQDRPPAAAGELATRLAPDRDTRETVPPDERLARAEDDFRHYVERASAATSSEALARWLSRLTEAGLELDRQVSTLRELQARDPAAARAWLDGRLQPFLVDEVQPLVTAYLSESEEEFGDQLRDIVAQGAETTRLALLTSALAVIIAAILGVLVWRSVHGPIVALRQAALRVARGHLDTRVDLPRHDEFGLLAESFNTMAAELERSTVSVAEKELLLREVHHRVKNNMQVVSSLLAMQAGESDDPATVASFRESQGRIRSMALIHEQLYRARDLARIDVAAYLRLLVDQLARSFGCPGSIELTLRAEDLPLDIDQAMSCGLIINELVANAYKHAFPEGGAGSVQVSLRAACNGSCELRVSDDGRGLPDPDAAVATPITPCTLGTSLVRMLVRQLHGQLSMASEHGADVCIVFPLRQVRAETAA